ncbi:MAG: hypothetical protein H0W77_13105 [Acidobacteria bacterium]|nr:hypothetical protein [Acidobacteriota bacterium]
MNCRFCPRADGLSFAPGCRANRSRADVDFVSLGFDKVNFVRFDKTKNRAQAGSEKIGEQLLDLSQIEDSVIDSFPVMLKRGKNAQSGRVACQIANLGYCASKDIYYHGVKLHNLAVRRTKSLPVPFQLFLTEASKHDLTAFKEEQLTVPTRHLFADKAY